MKLNYACLGLSALTFASVSFGFCSGMTLQPTNCTSYPPTPINCTMVQLDCSFLNLNQSQCGAHPGCSWRVDLPPTPPPPATVSLTVCNHSSIDGASVAIGFFVNNAWTARGYWNLNRGQCAVVLGDDFGVKNSNLYIYATTDVGSADAGTHWPGSFDNTAGSFCVSNDAGFTWAAGGVCQGHLQRFMKIANVRPGGYEFDLNN